MRRDGRQALLQDREEDFPAPYAADATIPYVPAYAPERPPFSELCRKVVLLADTDSFVLSHFQPLIGVLREVAHEVVVIARGTGRLAYVESLGTRVIDFDPAAPRSAARQAGAAWNLARILEAEAPDVLHTIGLKPCVLSSLALKLVTVPRIVVHMTGIGTLRFAQDRRSRLVRGGVMRLFGSLLKHPNVFLLVENRDDLALLRDNAADPGGRFAILGGAGVDPRLLPALGLTNNPIPVAAFVGRMVRAKGADIFMRAIEILTQHEVRVQPLMCGECEEQASGGLRPNQVKAWCQDYAGVWRDHVPDIREVWQNADIFVLPARGGEGMPRAMLEAAASQRPLIVSNVPGCKDFVRNGVEGFLVNPDDPQSLAHAIARLASDSFLRHRMGEAARMRLLHGFTEDHVVGALRQSYASLFQARR
ncbi:MAG: glycosyltransferase family 1 protein [Hyphomicrobiales bacterium]|nr:MAG: glycosyltransferase family 1 protein [Hyphomicrobiales bacterium]